MLFPTQLRQARRIIFPFFEPSVKEAFSEMVTQMGEGVRFRDAATAFCREILNGSLH